MKIEHVPLDAWEGVARHLDAYSLTNLAQTSHHFENLFRKSRVLQRAPRSVLHLTFRSQHISVCLDGYCYCFCEPGSLRRFANPDFTYCCCLHKWSFRRFVCPSEDFVYAATRAISKILRSKYFRVDVVHFLEHPWYMSMELDDSLFYQETPVTSVQKALQELGQNLEYPARVVLPYGYREHIGHCGGNFNSRFRIFHRRLLEGFDFDDAGKLINQLLDKGHESDAMAAEVLDQLEPWQVERYRELEARLSLPEGLFAAITPSEAHNTVQDFSRDLVGGLRADWSE